MEEQESDGDRDRVEKMRPVDARDGGSEDATTQLITLQQGALIYFVEKRKELEPSANSTSE